MRRSCRRVARGETIVAKPFRRRGMSAAPSSERTPWGLVILLGSLTAMGPLAIDMYLPSLPSIGAGLHATTSETQATVSAFLAGMAGDHLFYAPASDRLGRRPPLLFGNAVYIAA